MMDFQVGKIYKNRYNRCFIVNIEDDKYTISVIRDLKGPLGDKDYFCLFEIDKTPVEKIDQTYSRIPEEAVMMFLKDSCGVEL